MPDVALTSAFNAGMHSYWTVGLGIEQNPYADGTVEADAWIEGYWAAADQEAEQLRREEIRAVFSSDLILER